MQSCIYGSVTDAIHPFSVASVVEDHIYDWLLHNKHSRHILGVHSSVSLTASLDRYHIIIRKNLDPLAPKLS